MGTGDKPRLLQNGSDRARVAIALPPAPAFYVELGKMIQATVAELGLRASLVDDGNRGALQSDILLLAGDCRAFGKFARLLKRQGTRRPWTVLWHMEPLPPPEASERARQIGRWLLRCHWEPNALSRWLPRSVNGRLVGWAAAGRALLAARFCRAAEANGAEPAADIDEQSLAFAIRQSDWLLAEFRKGWIDNIFCTTPPRRRYLARHRIGATVVPVGHHSLWGDDLNLPRDIDVVFFGLVRNTRRERLLRQLESDLKRRGIRLLTVDDRSYPHGCFGAERTALLNRSKIVVNLVKFPWDFPAMRLLMSAACGAMIVSDLCRETDPFRAGEHFVGAAFAELADAIAYYLAHEDERRAMAGRAYRLVTQQLTLRRSLATILGCAGHAAPVRAA